MEHYGDYTESVELKCRLNIEFLTLMAERANAI